MLKRYAGSLLTVHVSPHKLQHTSCKCIPNPTGCWVLRKCLCLYAYKMQVVQTIRLNARVAHKEFAMPMLEKLDKDNEFLRR